MQRKTMRRAGLAPRVSGSRHGLTLRHEVLAETFAGLARDGKVSKRGLPGLLQLAVIAREFEEEGYGTPPPLAVQRALLGPLAAIGRRRGYRAWYPEAPIEAIFDALADARTYPYRWRPVYLGVEADGPPEVGRVSHDHFKGRLPYSLRLSSRVIRLERPTEIEGEVRGGLSGHSRWTLTPTDGRVHVRWDWRVAADRPFLRILTPLLRPLFRWNHDWAVARAMEGLEPYARERSGEGPRGAAASSS